MNNLGYCLLQQKDYSNLWETHYQKVFASRRKWTTTNIGYNLWLGSLFGKRKRIREGNIHLWESHQEPNNKFWRIPRTNNFKYAKSCFLLKGARTIYSKAIPIYEKLVDKYISTLGESHEETVKSMHELAYCLMELQNYSKAIPLYETVVAKRIPTIIGDSHANTLSSSSNLINWLEKNEQYPISNIHSWNLTSINVK